MLEFSKMYKFIVEFVIFFIVGVTTKNDRINDQLLCGHFQSRYPVTKFSHLSWSFLVSSLKFINFGHLSLKKTMVTKMFGLLVTNLSFSTSDIFFLKDIMARLMMWLDAPYNTLEIHTLEKFYHHPMSYGGNFPKTSYAYFTNNFILG